MNLKRSLTFLKNWVSLFVEPRRFLALRYFPKYVLDWRRYGRLAGSPRLSWGDSFPCLADMTAYTPFDAHYFFQAAWIARRLKEAGPRKHVDVGSSIGMISILSAFVPTLFIDYRPLRVCMQGLQSAAGDLLALPFGNESLQSVSSLHVLEHVGLGRYGDPLNPDGSRLAAAEISRVLCPDGRLYLSVPVGRERTQFNAQRVFPPLKVLKLFEPLQLKHFSLIDDSGRMVPDADMELGAACEYGCGLFEMVK